MSQEARATSEVAQHERQAVALVKKAVLTVNGSRSAATVEETIADFESVPGLRPAAGWSAEPGKSGEYMVSYSFINGSRGEERAIWSANLSTGKVKYINKNAKYFSWSPDY